MLCLREQLRLHDDQVPCPWDAFRTCQEYCWKTTAAAKQYKECSQSYMNAIRILSGILRNAEGDADDDLLARLEEFSR